MKESPATAAESDAAFVLMDDWLRIENEHTDPGLLLPNRSAVVAWCEDHALTILVVANGALWTPVLLAMWQG